MAYLCDPEIFVPQTKYKDILIKSFARTDHKKCFNLLNKSYIKINDKCMICISSVSSINNAYLTECGHTFHKSCLSNYFHFLKFKKPHKLILNCPLCRSNLGSPELIFTPFYNCFSNINYLDLLENISSQNFNELIHICSSQRHYSHYLGCLSNCEICRNYREG